jgi:hypothetical protein
MLTNSQIKELQKKYLKCIDFYSFGNISYTDINQIVLDQNFKKFKITYITNIDKKEETKNLLIKKSKLNNNSNLNIFSDELNLIINNKFEFVSKLNLNYFQLHNIYLDTFCTNSNNSKFLINSELLKICDLNSIIKLYLVSNKIGISYDLNFEELLDWFIYSSYISREIIVDDFINDLEELWKNGKDKELNIIGKNIINKKYFIDNSIKYLKEIHTEDTIQSEKMDQYLIHVFQDIRKID